MKRWTILTVAALVAGCQTTPELAPSTRLKDYEDAVKARMNVTWTWIANQRADLIRGGTARVVFKVLPDGHVSEVKVVSNSGNRNLADTAVFTVQNTNIPPIPRSALAELPHGYMPIGCRFTIVYGSPSVSEAESRRSRTRLPLYTQ